MQENRSLSIFIVISLVGHALCLVLLYLFSQGGFLSFVDHVVPEVKKTEVTTIRTAVRVDVVQMPRMTLRELKALEQQGGGGVGSGLNGDSSGQETQEATGGGDIEFLRKKQKKDFMSMLRNISKTKVDVDEKKIGKKGPIGVPGRYRGEIRNLLLAGNKLSKGTRFTGGGTSGVPTLFNSYLLSLPDSVRPFWKLPSYLMDRGLRCRVRIFLKFNGDLIKAGIYQSSGISEYDNKALNAVKKTKRFPPVPHEIRYRVLRGDILLGFPL